MYFSLEYVLTAIKRLGAIHPFYGMTFLSCKRNQLPVGHSINFPMDKYTKEFMDEIHKLNPLSPHYYQPYVSNDKEKCWVTYKYPSTGLHSINTQTFLDAFLHIDEIEAHLHPKWQRTILPAVLNIQSILSRELGIQFIVSTHSPLVLASVETRFNPEIDKLFNIMANKDCGDVELAVVDFIKYGQINSWLTSPIFNLKQPRSQEAEETIDEAKKIQYQKNPSTVDVVHIHEMLLEELAETDPFWPRWLYFAEKNGVTI